MDAGAQEHLTKTFLQKPSCYSETHHALEAHHRPNACLAITFAIYCQLIAYRSQQNGNKQVTRWRKEPDGRKISAPLSPLSPGDRMLLQHPHSKLWATSGVIVEVGPNRDYLIKTTSGRIFRRNRRLLRRRVPVMPGLDSTPNITPTTESTVPDPPVSGPTPANFVAVPPPGPRRSGRRRIPPRRYQAGTGTK